MCVNCRTVRFAMLTVQYNGLVSNNRRENFPASGNNAEIDPLQTYIIINSAHLTWIQEGMDGCGE